MAVPFRNLVGVGLRALRSRGVQAQAQSFPSYSTKLSFFRSMNTSAPAGKHAEKSSKLATVFGVSALLGATAATGYWLGRPFEPAAATEPTDASAHNVAVQYNNYDNEGIFQQYLHRARDRLMEYYNTYVNPVPEHILPPPPPGVPNNYVLVLTVEDFLIHQEWTPMGGWRTIKRPHLDTFLAYCLNLFGEVVLFSDKNLMESGGVVAKLDPDSFTHKLFRGHQRYVQGEYIKDLSLMDRDLKKVLLLDVDKEHFRLQPNNGLAVKPFHNDPNDRTLLELIPLLQAVVQLQVPDIRDVVRNFESVEDITEALAARRHFAQERARQQQEAAEEEAAVARQALANAPKRGKLASWLLPSK